MKPVWAQDLALRAPQHWPVRLRWLAGVAVLAALWFLFWSIWLEPLADQSVRAAQAELRLRADLRARQERLAQLMALPAAQALAQQRLAELEKQLPGPSDMQALLAAFSQCALARQLQLGLLRPQVPVPGPLYAEQHMALQLTGQFENLLGFAQDLSALPWAVAVHSFSLLPAPGDTLRMELVLRTLRVLRVEPPATAAEPVTSSLHVPQRVAALSPIPAMGPFNPLRSLPAAPIAARAPVLTEPSYSKPPLEASPLAAMVMVGSLLGSGQPVALLRFNGRIYQVRVGDQLGQNQGRVSEIVATSLVVREPANRAAGRQLEKTVRLNVVPEPS